MLVSRLKLLRMKYGITRAELSSACGLSKQRIYEIEARVGTYAPATAEKLITGLEKVIVQRQAGVFLLCADLEKHRSALLEYVEDNTYEL